MSAHKNARLTLYSRGEPVHRVLDEETPKAPVDLLILSAGFSGLVQSR